MDESNRVCLWEHPFNALVVGPTSCGKTVFVNRLLQSNIITPKPNKVYWFYGIYQPLYDELLAEVGDSITFHQGLPSVPFKDFIGDGDVNLFIFDDLMQEAGNDTRITELFVQGGHHMGISVIYITQNLYYKGSQMRTISLNAHYIVLFKNVRDKTQVRLLAQQMYPGNKNVLMDAYADAVQDPYGYLVVNLKTYISDRCRLTSNILQSAPTVYVPLKML
jgi:hypothetical protein